MMKIRMTKTLQPTLDKRHFKWLLTFHKGDVQVGQPVEYGHGSHSHIPHPWDGRLLKWNDPKLTVEQKENALAARRYPSSGMGYVSAKDRKRAQYAGIHLGNPRTLFTEHVNRIVGLCYPVTLVTALAALFNDVEILQEFGDHHWPSIDQMSKAVSDTYGAAPEEPEKFYRAIVNQHNILGSVFGFKLRREILELNFIDSVDTGYDDYEVERERRIRQFIDSQEESLS